MVEHKLNENLSNNWKDTYYAIIRSMYLWTVLDNDLDNATVTRIFLACGSDPTREGNAAIKSAAMYGHYNVVAALLEDDRVDPTADNNCAIRRASKNGHTEAVSLLLNDRRVKHTDNVSWIEAAIENAEMGEHYDIIQLLAE